MPPNPQAGAYAGELHEQPPSPPPPAPEAPPPAAAPAPADPHGAYPGAPPVQPPAGGQYTTNVLGERVPVGDFAADTPSAMIFADEREPRVVGTMLALGAIGFMVTALAVYGLALRDGEAGAVGGGFVLLGSLLWIWYLSLPREQQHTWLLRRYQRVARVLDRMVLPLRRRTKTRVQTRRERERYRAMRDERSRRVTELGELAYRSFRAGTLDPALVPHAQRVMAMEQQMLQQDRRLHELSAEDSSKA